MKRMLVLLLVLLVSLSMMTSCALLNGSKKSNENTEASSNVKEDAENMLETQSLDVEEADSDETVEIVEEIEETKETEDAEIAEDTEVMSDAEAVGAFAELMNNLAEEENMYVEARGTELAMIYVFDEEYDDAMLEIMAPLLNEQIATEDFYGTYVSIKSELPELSAFTVEFVTADGVIVYSQTYDDNYKVASEEAAEPESEASDAEEVDRADAEMVALIVDYVKESGALDQANSEGIATFDVYADGTVICMQVTLSEEIASIATEEDYKQLGEIIAESLNFAELKSLCPALSGMNVYIVDVSGNNLYSYEFN